MKAIEWITLASAVALAAGWFITNWLTRKNEIAKVRLKFRLEILSSYLDRFAEARENVKPDAGRVIVNEKYKLDLITSLERLSIFEGALAMCQPVYEKLGKNEPFGNEMLALRHFVVKRMKNELGIDD